MKWGIRRAKKEAVKIGLAANKAHLDYLNSDEYWSKDRGQYSGSTGKNYDAFERSWREKYKGKVEKAEALEDELMDSLYLNRKTKEYSNPKSEVRKREAKMQKELDKLRKEIPDEYGEEIQRGRAEAVLKDIGYKDIDTGMKLLKAVGTYDVRKLSDYTSTGEEYAKERFKYLDRTYVTDLMKGKTTRKKA